GRAGGPIAADSAGTIQARPGWAFLVDPAGRARRLAGWQRCRQDNPARSPGAAPDRRRPPETRWTPAGRMAGIQAARTGHPDRPAPLSAPGLDRRQHPSRTPRGKRRGDLPRRATGLRDRVFPTHASRSGQPARPARTRPVWWAGAARRPGSAVPARPRPDPARRAHRPSGRSHAQCRTGWAPGFRARPHPAARHPLRRGGAPAAAPPPAGERPHRGGNMTAPHNPGSLPTDAQQGDRPMGRGRLLAQIYRRHWPSLAATVALALLTALAGAGLLGVAGWFLTGAALAGAGSASAAQAFNLFAPSALVRGFSFIRIGARYAERLAGHTATLHLLAELRSTLFRALARLSPRQLARY